MSQLKFVNVFLYIYIRGTRVPQFSVCKTQFHGSAVEVIFIFSQVSFGLPYIKSSFRGFLWRKLVKLSHIVSQRFPVNSFLRARCERCDFICNIISSIERNFPFFQQVFSCLKLDNLIETICNIFGLTLTIFRIHFKICSW